VTRRELLRRTGVAGLAPAAAALGPLAAAPAARALRLDELRKIERAAVGRAISGEQVATVAFAALANGGALDDRTTPTMRVLLDHATDHADQLAKAFKQTYGDDPPLAPRRAEIPGLDAVRDQLGALRLAARIEEQAIAAHVAAVRHTHKGQILELIGGIVGADAQGLVLLRQLLGRPPAPSAFERGRP
jgi:hypothetical protein